MADGKYFLALKHFKKILPYFLLIFAYVIWGKLGLMLALPPGYASPVFPPAGIAIAAALIGGKKTLPWIFAGALLLNIWVGYSNEHQINSVGFLAATAIGMASMLQAAIGRWALRRAIGYPATLDHSTDILRFLILAPVLCLISATLSIGSLWALGNIDKADIISNWASWWGGDTLGVLVMFPIVMTLIGRPVKLWRSRISTVAIPMLLFFVIFVAIFLKINRWEYDNSLSDFKQLSHQAYDQVHARLEEQDALLDEITGLFLQDVDEHVTREKFHRFVQKALKRFPMIQALEWVPRVDELHRARFEAGQSHDLPEFEIREQNTDGKMVHANKRDAYYPVTYVEPLTGNQAAVGFDIASNAKRQGALIAALKSGDTVATESIHLVQDTKAQAGILILSAINPPDQASNFVLIVLRMDDFMNALLSSTRPLIYSRLIDVDEQTVLYDNFSPGPNKILVTQAFMFGTRHYRLETAPTPAYLKQHRGWQSFAVLTFGLFSTGLMGALLLLGTGYTARLKNEVRVRTEALSKESDKNRAILMNASDGIHVLDSKGKIIEVSDSFCKSLGYSRDEMIGMHASQWDAHFTDPEKLSLKIREQFNNPGRSQFETMHRRKDGSVFDVEVSGFPLELEGKPVLFNSSRDITERKDFEKQIIESEKNLIEILKLSPIAVRIAVKHGHQVVFCNQRYAELIKSDHPVGDDPGNYYAQPMDYEEVLKKISRGDSVYNQVIELAVPGGLAVWGLASYMPMKYHGENAVLSWFYDITERKLMDEQNRQLAFYDPLTSLPNRRLLNDRLSQIMSAGKRSGLYGALIFLDLDNFKPLNDTHGHEVGDLLLIEVAIRLKNCVRSMDSVARFGGDEFVVMLSELDSGKVESTAQAGYVAKKILAALSEPFLLSVGAEGTGATVMHRCTASIGVAVFSAHEASQDDIIKWADAAMYQAKDAGRNQIRFYA